MQRDCHYCYEPLLRLSASLEMARLATMSSLPLLLLALAARTAALVAPRAPRARPATRRQACLVQIDSDGSRQQIECRDGSAEYLRDRNDGAAGSLRDRAYASTRRNLRRIFLPVAVNEEYVSYTRWRCVQRLLSATVNVFGVQAMVMAVGLRDAKAVAAGGAVVGAAAAVDWVLKDALGKVPTRRPAVLRRLHAIDARRLQERRSWVVSFSILRPFGLSRATAMLRAGPQGWKAQEAR